MEDSFELWKFMTVVGLVAVFLIFVAIIKCCLESKPIITRKGIRQYGSSRHHSEQVERTVENLQSSSRQDQNIIDEDGFLIIPDSSQSQAGPAVTITTTTHPISASPVVVPPYPVEPRHPTPHQGAPMPGFSNPPYPTHNPYPVAGVPMYYPPPMGGAHPYPPMSVPLHQTPYPPTGPPYPDYGNQPPSYSEAVGQPSVPPPPTREVYAKQAPYNPNY